MLLHVSSGIKQFDFHLTTFQSHQVMYHQDGLSFRRPSGLKSMLKSYEIMYFYVN